MKKNKKAKVAIVSLTLLTAGALVGQANANDPLQYRSLGTGKSVRSTLILPEQKVSSEKSEKDKVAAGWFDDDTKSKDMKHKDGKCGEGKCGDDMADEDMTEEQMKKEEMKKEEMKKEANKK